jgi:hypothetical protein
MRNIVPFLLPCILLIIFGCQHEPLKTPRDIPFNKVSFLEYEIRLNDREQKMDVVLLSLFEVDTSYHLKAYNFIRSKNPVYKSGIGLKKAIDHCIEVYSGDTLLQGSYTPFCHCPEYVIIFESPSGSLKTIAFSPHTVNKDVESILKGLNFSLDRVKRKQRVESNINKDLQDHYERVVRQKVGVVEYPVPSTIDFPRPPHSLKHYGLF